MKKLTHIEFIERLNKQNKYYSTGKFKVLSRYVNSSTKLRLKDEYGECLISPVVLLKGHPTNIKSAINKTEYFKNKLINKNEHYRNGEFEVVGEYFREDKKVLIKDRYGLLSIKPIVLLKGFSTSIKAALNKTEYFINRAKEIHGDKYDYNLADYTNNKTKVKIICPQHGVFQQTPNCHLQSRGCEICKKENNSFKLSDWKQMCPGNPGIFYILKCWNDDEEFYKIGITCQDSVMKRYPSAFEMPYSFEIIKEVFNYDRHVIWNLEKQYKKELREFHYKPLITFNGSSSECFKRLS